MGGLEAGDAAAGGGDADGSAGVGAEGDVGVAGGDGDRRAAGGPAGDEGGIEWADRRPGPGVGAEGQHGQLVQVGLADDAGAGGTGARQAGGVGGRRPGRALDGLRAGGGGHAGDVDDVLDGEAGPVAGGVERGDEGGHGRYFDGPRAALQQRSRDAMPHEPTQEERRRCFFAVGPGVVRLALSASVATGRGGRPGPPGGRLRMLSQKLR